jgi:predicted sugar kinase
MAKKKEFDLNEVERLASLGLTEEQIGLALGVSPDTMTRRKQDTAEFAEAIKRGKALGIGHVTNKLRELIDSGNPTSTLFFLKCKAGWNEQAEIERRIEELENRLKGT